MIKDGVNGFVVPKQNSAELAEGIKRLLTDDALYKRLSDGSEDIFKKTFTAEVMTRNTENLYIKIIDNKERG